MKIEYVNRVEFGCLAPGDVFESEDVFYLKCRPMHGGNVNAAVLKCGTLAYFQTNVMVKHHPDARVAV